MLTILRRFSSTSTTCVEKGLRTSVRFLSSLTSIAACMERECIVPDIIDCAPEKEARVFYGGGCKVDLGKELSPTQVQEMPSVTWDASENSFYALWMTDPDAPSRKDPRHREWHHWLVGNIPGCKVLDGQTLSTYLGAAPLAGTFLHRYVFLIYQQPQKINFTEPRLNSTKYRKHFSTRDFAYKYNLGEPVAGNFFQAQWDGNETTF